jgi:cell wall-associated NlpC family hydrolase
MRRSTILALAASAMCLGPLGGARLVAQAGDQPQSLLPVPSQQEKPFAALSRAILEGRDSLARLSRQQVGLRYRYGALRPGTAFDCSGLVKWVMSMFDLHLPRTAAEQARLGLEVPKDITQLLPGDLLFFGRGREVTHIGIYIGEGKYVHAANQRKGVIESEITATNDRWWKGARRLFVDPDAIKTLFTTAGGS